MKKIITASAALLLATAVQAQKIDFNYAGGYTDDRVREPNYTAWFVGTEQNAFSETIDGIKFTISLAPGSAGKVVKGNWYKNRIASSKLVLDGITANGLEGGNTPQIQSGAVAIQVVIEGLAAGLHSIMAYHNNTDGYNNPPLKVIVNGTTLAENIVQTNRVESPSACGMSYVKFTATEGEPVTVIYQTVPDPSFDYTTGYNSTSLFINALVLDRPNPRTTAADPVPGNQDTHADCDGGSATLTWTAATSAVKHHIYMGNTSGSLTKLTTTTAASYQATGLDPMKTYYWRIDEEDADGNVYEGEEWMFRPRRLAFPGAEGYGRFAIGGRGGSVYHVTSLDDDVDNPAPGTFRYGITRVSGPRTIVFDVAGVITLKGRLTCSDKYVTIAGQTAPGRGIMLRGAPFGMASDGITRFIRARIGGGDAWDGTSPNPYTSDGLGMAGNDYAIMDHCSVGWTIDEAFSSRNALNVTLQRTLISEALNQAGHKNYYATNPSVRHGYAATIGGSYGSYHHNLLAHNEGRNWSLSGGLDGVGAYAGHHDIFNNVVYNWGGRATDGGTHEGNFVNNYYKMGPATTQKFLLNAQLEGTGSGSQAYYVSGNIREELSGTRVADALDNTYKYTLSGGQQLTWDVFVSAPFFPSYATIESAEAAFQNVLSDVGCNQPELDNHDQRMVSETLLGTTSTVGCRSNKPGLIDRESDSEGYDGLNITYSRRTADFDTDQDGIADWYEEARGWSTASADNNEVSSPDGYTHLEEYLNWLAEPHFLIENDTDADIDLKPYFAGYQNYTITLSAMTSDGNTWYLDDDTKIVTVTSEGSSPLFTIRATATDSNTGVTLTRSFNFCAMPAIPETETAIATLQTTAADVVSTEYYTLDGRRTLTPQGICIQIQHMANGQVVTKKIIR